MKYLIYLAALLVLAGFNVGIFRSLPLAGQVPNLLFLFVLCFVLEKKDYDFFFVAFFTGLFLDLYATGFFGGWTLGLLLVVVALHGFANWLTVVGLNWKSLGFVLTAALLLLNLELWLYGLVISRFNWSGSYVPLNAYVRAFLPQLLYDGLLLYPVYVYYNLIMRWVENLSLKRRGIVRR